MRRKYIHVHMYVYIGCPNQLHIYITFVPANTRQHNKSKSGQIFFCLAHVLLEALNLENELGRAIDKRYTNERQTAVHEITISWA